MAFAIRCCSLAFNAQFPGPTLPGGYDSITLPSLPPSMVFIEIRRYDSLAEHGPHFIQASADSSVLWVALTLPVLLPAPESNHTPDEWSSLVQPDQYLALTPMLTRRNYNLPVDFPSSLTRPTPRLRFHVCSWVLGPYVAQSVPQSWPLHLLVDIVAQPIPYPILGSTCRCCSLNQPDLSQTQCP